MPIISIVSHPNDQRGFTLVEALVAILILIVGIVALYTLQIGAIHGNARANSIFQVASLGTNRIEKIFTFENRYAELRDVNGDGASCNSGTATDANPNPLHQCGLNNPLQANGAEPNYQNLGWTCAPYLTVGAGVGWTADQCEVSQDGRSLIFMNVVKDIPAQNIATIRVKTVTNDFGQPIVTTTTYFMSNDQP